MHIPQFISCLSVQVHAYMHTHAHCFRVALSPGSTQLSMLREKSATLKSWVEPGDKASFRRLPQLQLYCLFTTMKCAHTSLWSVCMHTN